MLPIDTTAYLAEEVSSGVVQFWNKGGTMTDIMRIALAKRERLMADLEKLNEFIRMAERLAREEGEEAPRQAARQPAEAAPVAPPAPAPQPAPAQATPADSHRSLSSVLREVEEKEAEAAGETLRRPGLWRAAHAAGAKG